MADKKNPLDAVDAATAKLIRAVQANTEAEVRELNQLPAKYTRATGMEDPELDVSPLKYDPTSS